MPFHKIVPLVHLHQVTHQRTFDGSGFITLIHGQPTLVTCAHNFVGRDSELSFFTFEGQDIRIDRESANFFKDDYPDTGGIVSTLNGPELFVKDYAFLILPDFQVNNPLELISTKNIQIDDALTLISHDPDNGLMVRLPCQRNGRSESVDSMEVVGGIETGVRHLNLIGLICEGIEQGHSGGAVVHNETNNCIGFLHSGENPHASIIKAQTIEKEFHRLRQASQ